MNIILLLFIILATMFVASGVNNVVTVMSGTDYYFDLAGIGDYVVITMGDNAIGALDPILEDEPTVENYRLENVIYAAEKNFTAQGEKVKTKTRSLSRISAEAGLSSLTRITGRSPIFRRGMPMYPAILWKRIIWSVETRFGYSTKRWI